jgi:hypothetical protein
LQVCVARTELLVLDNGRLAETNTDLGESLDWLIRCEVNVHAETEYKEINIFKYVWLTGPRGAGDSWDMGETCISHWLSVQSNQLSTK